MLGVSAEVYQKKEREQDHNSRDDDEFASPLASKIKEKWFGLVSQCTLQPLTLC